MTDKKSGQNVVLFINDDKLWARMAPEDFRLKSEGKWKTYACTTEKALHRVLTQKGKEIDAALVDIRLDEGFKKDSWEIAQDLKKRGIKVGFASALVEEWQEYRAKEMGIPAYELGYAGAKDFGFWEILQKIVGEQSSIRKERGR